MRLQERGRLAAIGTKTSPSAFLPTASFTSRRRTRAGPDGDLHVHRRALPGRAQITEYRRGISTELAGSTPRAPWQRRLYRTAGRRTVTLKVTDTEGIDIATATVAVNAPPSAALHVSPAAAVRGRRGELRLDVRRPGRPAVHGGMGPGRRRAVRRRHGQDHLPYLHHSRGAYRAAAGDRLRRRGRRRDRDPRTCAHARVPPVTELPRLATRGAGHEPAGPDEHADPDPRRARAAGRDGEGEVHRPRLSEARRLRARAPRARSCG